MAGTIRARVRHGMVEPGFRAQTGENLWYVTSCGKTMRYKTERILLTVNFPAFAAGDPMNRRKNMQLTGKPFNVVGLACAPLVAKGTPPRDGRLAVIHIETHHPARCFGQS